MGLTLRITYKEKDYVYEILNASSVRTAKELEILLDGTRLSLMKDARQIWVQSGEELIEPEFAQAIGRSVSLRFRL